MQNEKENKPDVIQMNPLQYGYPGMFQKEDEIDLYKLFTSIFLQWKLLVTITLAGTLLTVIVTLIMSSQYEAVAQVARPIKADIKAINIRGYEAYSPQQIFIKYYDQLRSTEHFKRYIKKYDWVKKLFPDEVGEVSEDRLFLNVYSRFEINVLRPKKNKTDGQDPEPELVSVAVTGADEKKIVELVNSYVVYTNDYLIEKIKQKGRYSISLEVEQIQKTIAVLRLDARVRRELLISKLEEQNKEKIAGLEDEKKSLLVKAKRDKESKIAMLEEAYGIAEKIGIKKLTTLEAQASQSNKANTLVSLGGKNNQIYALMGTIYLKSELDILKDRKNNKLFIPEISEINKQIDDIKHDEKLFALKERKSDDPYITELAGLFKHLDELKHLSFDFSGVQLYRLDKNAYADGNNEKPKRLLIVAVGFVLSAFVSLFIVMIINSIKKHRDMESE